jgi:hypothetical protein
MPQSDPPSRSAISSWMGESTNFALEMFVDGIEGPPHLVGVRWLGQAITQVTDFIGRAHRTLQGATRPDATAPEVLSTFEDALHMRLLHSAPSFLELDVNNLWKSIGSLVIWRQGQAVPSRNQLRDELTEHAPQLLVDRPNAIVLKVWYAYPQPHWLGLSSSQQVAARYRLEIDEVLDIAYQVGRQASFMTIPHRH